MVEKIEDSTKNINQHNVISNDKTMLSRSEKTYTLFRKEALDMQSLATQHFKAAATAYHMHDHLSAQQHSRAGRENLRVAQEQNLKAAEEIFKFNNRKNKIWRIDLHGLHGSEAVQALERRLNEIKSDKIDTILVKKLNSLEVITGVGKHSHGKPVLPTIVRSFLNQNKYQFEEVRPGALKVWLNSSSSQAIRSK